MDIKEAIEEGKGKERKCFSRKKRKRKKYYWNRGWVRKRLLQLLCFGTSDTSTTDHGVAVVDEREEEEKKGKHLMIMSSTWTRKAPGGTTMKVGVLAGQMTGEIEMKIGNPVALLQPDDVEAVKKPLRPTVVDGDIVDGESKSRPFFHIFSPKAHKKEERKGIKNQSHPQPFHVQLDGADHPWSGVGGGPVADVLFSPKPESSRSRSVVVDDLLLPSSTPKVTQPALSSCPIFSSTGCRKMERAEDAEVEASLRSDTDKKTDNVVVVKKSDLRLIGFVGFAVLILTTLVGGRAFAAICTSLLFYFAPSLRAESSSPNIVVIGDAKAKKDDLGIDYESEEYKKKVVLEGLLERTGRRQAGSSHN